MRCSAYIDPKTGIALEGKALQAALRPGDRLQYSTLCAGFQAYFAVFSESFAFFRRTRAPDRTRSRGKTVCGLPEKVVKMHKFDIKSQNFQQKSLLYQILFVILQRKT